MSATKLPPSLSLAHEKGHITVRLKPNVKAKRLILRLDAKSGEPVATIPPGLSRQRLETFLTDNMEWLIKRMDQRPARVPFVAGVDIPVRDIAHSLVHVDQKRGTVRQLVDGDHYSLLVSGEEEHMPRRVTDWLKKQARADLQEAVDRHASTLSVKPAAIRIKDTTSRWGSCSSNRILSFSWRIIFAPPCVLDYLAAHEVAHLREMNHSSRFWALVEELCPHFEEAKVWLKEEGRHLHRFGA
ncbi:MAG: M48 family metallopeptidase [Cohaesibacter sp.]|nr:M48 family metallopeptidase [Cohaesibacter sp.]